MDEFHKDLQFYPTPIELGRKAWSLFKNKEFVRVLEPSAGQGDLIKAMPYFNSRYSREVPVDACEVDISKHSAIRDTGAKIVGIDFLDMQSCVMYSHIIQNPPFSEGVSHVLKAWDSIYDGEIVSIINAETLRNPYSRERQLLMGLIERYGSVEYVQGAFSGESAKRKTEVEVALVYLRKVSNLNELVADDLIGNLIKEKSNETADMLSHGYDQAQELAVPATAIENIVVMFEAAVQSMRDAVIAEARSNRYASRLGLTMAEILNNAPCKSVESSIEWVKKEITSRYLSLKDKAWANILRSTQVSSKLSSAAQKRIESEFKLIQELEFTIANIRGFLRGLLENQNQIMLDMACDIFDSITKYHTDNLVFYKGWKSNDRQRTCGMRIKTTRFVLPRFEPHSYGLCYGSMRQLNDFDKVFAMLDGRAPNEDGQVLPEFGLEYTFKNYYERLCSGERLISSYFDVRYYPGAQTIHFFARDKNLIEKFNKLVGHHRKWLPPSDVNVSSDFWKQFKNAEKFDKQIRDQINDSVKGTNSSRWDHPLMGVFRNDEAEAGNAMRLIDQAVTTVLERNGISTEFQLEQSHQDMPEQLMLLAA